MWLYQGPSCPDRYSEELSAAEINSWIHKVLDHGANPNPGVGPIPLREGVASTRVSLFGPVSTGNKILSFHRAHGLAQVLGGARNEPRGVKLSKDAARQDANHALNEKMWSQKERKKESKPGPEVPPVGRRKSGGRILPLNLSS
jgi:hypothetical protein